MTASDVERQLAALLHHHAEEAMNQTDTRTELNRLQDRLEDETAGRTRRRAAAVAAGVAAAVGVGAFWFAAVDDSDERSGGPAGDPRSAQTTDERVAQDFVSSFAAGDMDGAASLLAEDAQMLPGWRDRTLPEAYGVEHFVQPCETTSTSQLGARIECPFTYHARGSKELGMEPFDASQFIVVVDGGQVRSFDAFYGHTVNGEGDLRDDIGAWVRQNYPGEWQFLDSRPSQAEKPRFVALWQERIQEYVDAQREG